MPVMATEDKIMEIDPRMVRSRAEYEKGTHSNCEEAEEENENEHLCREVLLSKGARTRRGDSAPSQTNTRQTK